MAKQALRAAYGATDRSDMACPFIWLVIMLTAGTIGYVNWEQGYFIQPNEGRGGCQGEDASFGNREAQWRAAWVGDCAFLYRNEIDTEAGFRRPGQTFHGQEYDTCYRAACRVFCADHMCHAKVIAIALWVIGSIAACVTLTCIGMTLFKILEAVRQPEEEASQA